MLLVWAGRPASAQPCLNFEGCQWELDGKVSANTSCRIPIDRCFFVRMDSNRRGPRLVQLLVAVEIRSKKDHRSSNHKLLPSAHNQAKGLGLAYVSRRLKVEKEEACHRAEHHTNAGGKVLRNVVGIEDAECCNYASKRLKEN
jgi:hypothetical protein